MGLAAPAVFPAKPEVVPRAAETAETCKSRLQNYLRRRKVTEPKQKGLQPFPLR